MSFEKEKKQIVYWARFLNQRRLVTAKNGNVSCRVAENKVLITSHGAYLGLLEDKDVLLMDLDGKILEGDGAVTAEKGLHLSIYRRFPDAKVVFHAHSPYTTAFFNYFDSLDIFSFETKLYLGPIQVVEQNTPSVTDIEPVLAALENSNVAVLKNHGVVSLGSDFKDAFGLIELLEEQAKVNFMLKAARPPGHQVASRGDKEKDEYTEAQAKYEMLSGEHMDRLAELVNNDNQAQELGRKYDLTCTLAVKNSDTNQAMRFSYQKGRIVGMDNSDDAEFVIIGKPDILKKVFNRQVDPFVALTQGKVKSKGDFTRMSKWYPVMVRTFQLWEQAPVE